MSGSDPAFVLTTQQQREETTAFRCGLTKRELFAAMAMHGLMASGKWTGDISATNRDAIRLADDLLAELEKKSD
jgi:hypothetical protein